MTRPFKGKPDCTAYALCNKTFYQICCLTEPKLAINCRQKLLQISIIIKFEILKDRENVKKQFFM